MLDFGWPELLLVAVVAIFAAGPNDIPKILYELGKIMRRLQYLRFSMSRQFDQFMRENGYDDLRPSMITVDEPTVDNSSQENTEQSKTKPEDEDV